MCYSLYILVLLYGFKREKLKAVKGVGLSLLFAMIMVFFIT